MKVKQILTIGNPNSGKTTLFNRLTGSRQAIGNWAGVTVDKKTGVMECGRWHCELTDLPGTYSLDSADLETSPDEVIAVNALFALDADLIINIVDASALERSLYLTLQLRELGRPMIVVLNKMDVLAATGYQVDAKKLAAQLGCAVVELTATDIKSVANLKSALAQCFDGEAVVENGALHLDYGAELESLIAQQQQMQPAPRYGSARAHALKALTAGAIDSHLDLELMLANVRYSNVATHYRDCVTQVKSITTQITDKLDNWALHPVFGIPLFFVVMYVMFMFSINIGGAFIDFFDISVGALLVDGTHQLLDPYAPIWLVTLLADGVGAGIQTVATFIPVIACLYLFMSLLESSGYMARAAFVLDKAMQRIGLSGKAFVPLILGFGCNVPAIMATRTLDQERERRLTASMAHFMSCGARLPVYALFAAAFFPEHGQNAVFVLYLLGILAAIFTGFVLRHTLFPGESTAMIMEMPRYELPRLKDAGLKTWFKLRRFVLGAGKTIVIVVTILNFLNSIGTDGSFGHQHSEQSVLSRAAQFVTPALTPIGIEADNWQATVGIITGLFAKEAVVGTLNSLYLPADTDADPEFNLAATLQEALYTIPDNLFGLNFADPLGISVGELNQQQTASEQGVQLGLFTNLTAHFTAASAMAYLVFILLYTPCVAAMGAYVREFGRGFACFVSAWSMLLAFVAATLCYQGSRLLVTPAISLVWILIALSVLAAALVGLYFYRNKIKMIEAKA